MLETIFAVAPELLVFLLLMGAGAGLFSKHPLLAVALYWCGVWLLARTIRRMPDKKRRTMDGSNCTTNQHGGK